MFNKNNLLMSICFIATAGILSQDIKAQDEESSSRLEEIVVTAQKKEEGLSEVPISIQVLSDDRIADLGITSFESLADHVPGLHISKGAAEWNIYMRGVGSGANKGFSQSITQFIDGMPITKGQQYSAGLLDVERVEVLKGTQGVLFGKNTIGGVINTVSKSPVIGGDQDGYYNLEFVPEWNTKKFQGAMNIPVNDSFAMRLAYSNQSSDGYTKNRYLNTDGPDSEATSVRATFLWELESTEINLKLTNSINEKNSQESGISTWGLAAPFPQLAQAGYTGAVIAWNVIGRHFPDLVSGSPGETYLDNTQGLNPTGGTNENNNAILKISTTLAGHDITSTTSFSEYDYVWGLDADFGPMNFISTDSFHDFSSVTQEIVISSPADDKFEYIAGVFYDDVDYYSVNNGTFDMTIGGLFGKTPFTPNPNLFFPNIFFLQTQGAFSSPDAATHTLFDQNSSTLSIFAEGTFYINDQLTVKAGVRFSEDDKDVKGSQVFSSSATGGLGIDFPTMAPPVVGVMRGLLGRVPYNFPVQNRSETHTTPSLKVLYDLSDTTRLYMSYADGYKAGGFDGSENASQINATTPAPAFQFEPEEATTLEIGAKMDFPEKSLRANIAYFTTEYSDLQVSAWNGTSFVVSNAASADISGLETDVTWAPTDNVVIGASVTSLDFEYTSFTNASCTATQEVAYRLATGLRDCTQDLTGQSGNYTPELSASMYVNYYKSLSAENNLEISLSANKVGEHYSNGDNDPLGLEEESTKINARFSIVNSTGIEISLFARNLTDERTASFSLDLPLVPGSHFKLWNPGKEIGLTMKKNF